MAKALAINVSMFNLSQQVRLIDSVTGEDQVLGGATMDRLGEYAASYAVSNDIDEISIIGQKDFAQKVIYDLKEFLGSKYSEGKVRVILNGQICN